MLGFFRDFRPSRDEPGPELGGFPDERVDAHGTRLAVGQAIVDFAPMLAAKARAELGHLADTLGATGLVGVVSGGARREAGELAPAAGEDVAGFGGLLL